MKKAYIRPQIQVYDMRVIHHTNQTVPIFGEGSHGGGPGIADGKEIDFGEDEDDFNPDVWTGKRRETWKERYE